MKNLEFKEVEIPEIVVVGFQDKLSSKGGGHLWDQLYERIGEISNIVNSKVGYGIIDSGAYIAGVQVQLIEKLPEGMASIVIPKKTYYMFIHKGPIYTLLNTWNQISANCQLNGLSFERYDERFNPTSEDSILELFISAL